MDDDELWLPAEDGVPPVIGRRDPSTNEPMMRYDTEGEVSVPVDGGPGERYQTDDGVDVSISF
jgi:hypothetical protein